MLLSRSLKAVPGYEYLDYMPAYAQFRVDNLNRVPQAKDLFASMSLHMVLKQRHLISMFQLYSLRDATSAANVGDLVDIVVKLHSFDPSFTATSTSTIGSITVYHLIGDGFQMWMWTQSGILYTVWDITYTGNDAYAEDFIAAYVSQSQDLPIPAPTVKTPPGNKSLAAEDDALAARLAPVEDFLYVDAPYDYVAWFYAAFKGVPFLERGSLHYLVHGGDLATSDYAASIGMLQLLELRNSLKKNPKTIKAFVSALVRSVADKENRLEVTTETVGSVTVWKVRHLDWDIETMAYVWELGGVTYLFDSNPECTGACEENIGLYVAGLITATETLLAQEAATTTTTTSA